MPTTIKCPNCAHEFPLEEAVSEEYKKELREQMVAYKKQKEEERGRFRVYKQATPTGFEPLTILAIRRG